MEKRRKRWRNKRRGYSTIWRCEWSEVLECEDWCSLEELHEWEQAKEKRKIERVRENCERYTVRKRAVSEKRKKVFLYSSCISKCCNLYFNIVKLFRFSPVVFPFKKKGFPLKSLYSCVIVFPLCLLKFIHSYIEFFPTKTIWAIRQ